jgi:hypothetical protein
MKQNEQIRPKKDLRTFCHAHNSLFMCGHATAATSWIDTRGNAGDRGRKQTTEQARFTSSKAV